MASDAPDWTQPASTADMTAVTDKLDTVIANTNPINAAGDHSVVSVGTSATLIRTTVGLESLAIHNGDATKVVYVGFANTITSSGSTQGYPLQPGADVAMDLAAGISVYGIVATGSVSVNLLRISQA